MAGTPSHRAGTPSRRERPQVPVLLRACAPLLAVLPLGASAGAVPAGPPQRGGGAADGGPPNILVLVLDDVGVDVLASYGEGTDLPVTPTLDALAASGVQFRNAWSQPVCAPTRASIQTGRAALRTGIGNVLKGNIGTFGLQLSEVTLPEMLDADPTPAGYAHAAIGKWHLASQAVGGYDAPNDAGYSHFAGSMGNLQDYYNWEKVEDGVVTQSTTYATVDTANETLAWIGAQTGPWFCHVAFNSCHFPYHAPPTGLYTEDLSTAGDPKVNPRPYFKAMLEAIDDQIGRILAGLGGMQLANTVVIVVGDNGTPAEVVAPPFLPTHAKGTLYEGSLNVPLIVSGPVVTAPGESQALVHTNDLFATIAEIADVDLADPAVIPAGTKLDSVSLLPHVVDPALPSTRTSVISERFLPNGIGTGLPVPLPPDPQNYCQIDLGFGGPGTAVLGICGQVLAEGNFATLSIAGAPVSSVGFLGIGGMANPTPVLGGTIVPLPIAVILNFFTDANGAASIPMDGSIANSTAYFQAAVPDPGFPGGFAFTNALQVDYLPANSKVARDGQYKLIWSVNGGPQELYDLAADPFEQADLIAGGSLSPAEQAALTQLEADIDALIADYP